MNQEIHPATLDELYATIDELVPASKEHIPKEVACTTQQVKTADTSFNLTKNIQKNLDALQPTVVYTEYKSVSLSAEEIQSLVPVPDRTLTQLLSLFAGKSTTPFMLDDTLLAHTADGQYLRIVPEINDDGYANYKFTAVNYKALNFLIDKYCELLQRTPYYTNLFGYQKDAPVYDYGDNDGVDYTDVDTHFGPVTSIKVTKAKSNITDDDDGDAYTLKNLNKMLKARMQSSQKHLSLRLLSERLASQISLYTEDMELLEYLRLTVKHVYKDLGIRYYLPYTPYFDPPYRISGHYLSEWVYNREEYTVKITNGNGDYQVDHIKRGFEYRSDNRPDNLRIVPADFNKGRTSRSIEVTYNDEPFVSLSAYCDKTYAGDYDTLLDLKTSLQPDETKEYKGRTYTFGEKRQLIVTDADPKVPPVLFNGTPYASLKGFADEVKLRKNEYDALRQALSRARKVGKTEYIYRHKGKKYTVYLATNGDIEITL